MPIGLPPLIASQCNLQSGFILLLHTSHRYLPKLVRHCQMHLKANHACRLWGAAIAYLRRWLDIKTTGIYRGVFYIKRTSRYKGECRE